MKSNHQYQDVIRNVNFKFIGAIIVLIFAIGCKKDKVYTELNGKGLDQAFTIIYDKDSLSTLSKDMDALIKQVEMQLDEDNEKSTISRFNAAADTFYLNPSDDVHFIKAWDLSKSFSSMTSGFFDPSLDPLYDYFGHEYDEKRTTTKRDTSTIEALLKLKAFDKMSIINEGNKSYIIKPDAKITINFTSIKYGYIVDRMASILDAKQVRNYIIEMDGKCASKGTGPQSKEWTYGVNKPKDGVQATDKELPLRISGKGLAASGPYIDAQASKGLKFAKIVDPMTGFGKESDILNTTVIADDCVTADALATAFMSMGLERSLTFLTDRKNIGACFIYDTEGDGKFEYKISPGFSQYYLDNEQK